MAKKKADPDSNATDTSGAEVEGRRPRLNKLSVKNFRCIGATPVEIELDDIVVLVGPNNAGKSSILKAYNVVMSDAALTQDDFPNGRTDGGTPEIELETVVYDYRPGERWIRRDEITGEMFVRERWLWKAPGPPTRQGFDVKQNGWATDGVPWGAPNVAQAGRPIPHPIDAFASPAVQAKEIIELLSTAITQRIAQLTKPSAADGENGQQDNTYQELLISIGALQKRIVEESRDEIARMEDELSVYLAKVFPGYQVTLDARPEDEIDKCVQFFKPGARLLVGPNDGFKSSVEFQGSGARRTLLWTALKFLAEAQPKAKKRPSKTDSAQAARPHVLLLDEPEICLHPSAIRDACSVLYDDLPATGLWQVIVTTHSPAFIDVSRNNTTIVRVERRENGEVFGTTVFRPTRAHLDKDDQIRIKLMNVYDPYVAEFFFGGFTIVVEGDTEYTAFKHVIAQTPNAFKDVHIIRARGKATIVSVVKILNQFGSGYSVLHDSDTPVLASKKANPAWSLNTRILEEVGKAPNIGQVRLLASVPNFEVAYLGREVSRNKPYNAIEQLRNDDAAFARVEALLRALIDPRAQPPGGCIEWRSETELEGAVQATPLAAATSA